MHSWNFGITIYIGITAYSGTLAAFAAALRGNVSLDNMTDRLLAAVNETMQPAEVSLWLRHIERLTDQHRS